MHHPGAPSGSAAGVKLASRLTKASLAMLGMCSSILMPHALLLCSDPAQPLPAWRRAIVVAGSKSTKVILAMLGVWVRFHGWENVERGRQEHAVVIFNHVSFVSGRNFPNKCV